MPIPEHDPQHDAESSHSLYDASLEQLLKQYVQGNERDVAEQIKKSSGTAIFAEKVFLTNLCRFNKEATGEKARGLLQELSLFEESKYTQTWERISLYTTIYSLACLEPEEMKDLRLQWAREISTLSDPITRVNATDSFLRHIFPREEYAHYYPQVEIMYNGAIPDVAHNPQSLQDVTISSLYNHLQRGKELGRKIEGSGSIRFLEYLAQTEIYTQLTTSQVVELLHTFPLLYPEMFPYKIEELITVYQGEVAQALTTLMNYISPQFGQQDFAGTQQEFIRTLAQNLSFMKSDIHNQFKQWAETFFTKEIIETFQEPREEDSDEFRTTVQDYDTLVEEAAEIFLQQKMPEKALKMLQQTVTEGHARNVFYSIAIYSLQQNNVDLQESTATLFYQRFPDKTEGKFTGDFADIFPDRKVQDRKNIVDRYVKTMLRLGALEHMQQTPEIKQRLREPKNLFYFILGAVEHLPQEHPFYQQAVTLLKEECETVQTIEAGGRRRLGIENLIHLLLELKLRELPKDTTQGI